MQPKIYSMEWAGRELKIEFGRFAGAADGAALVQYGDTVILATAVMSENTREGIDFFPLTVELEERMYAAGKIKGSRFIKREGRPSDEAILSGRLVDRSIRPLFDGRMRKEIQVVVTTLAYDSENDPEVPALLAASLALGVSRIPWDGPIAGVRVGVDAEGNFIVNATHSQLEKGMLDLYAAGDGKNTIMIEAGANVVPEEKMFEAIKHAQEALVPVIKFIKKIIKEIGAEKTRVIEENEELERAIKEVQGYVHMRMKELFFNSPKANKGERRDAFTALKKGVIDDLSNAGFSVETASRATGMIKEMVEDEIVLSVLKTGKRVDGRGLTDVRDLMVEVGVLPRIHGSAHFKRGETQVLSTVTLGSPGDKQTIDTMETDEIKRYMHHYNFPPYSVGEVKPMRGPGRRDIGHGALAEKALMPVLPPEEKFPYAIRVVSEVLASNGSSSMASACGSSLALMDAGVPLTTHVAGIAMGLMSEEEESGGTGTDRVNIKEWKVITDLQDLEDGKGGMDFKICGTREGITAIQLDTKTHGLMPEIVEKALKQAREGRMKILDAMEAVISAPRKEMSPYAPRIETIIINPEKIRDVIGPGGKMINKIINETGVDIDIEQDGRVMITSSDAEAMKKAVDWVRMLTHEVAAGEEYDGTVSRLEDFGAFVNILPGQDGLVHVSEIAWNRTNNPSDVLKLGDKVRVVVKEIDNLGRINLSMKELLPKPEGWQPPAPRDFGDRGPRDFRDRGQRGGSGRGGSSQGRGGRGGSSYGRGGQGGRRG